MKKGRLIDSLVGQYGTCDGSLQNNGQGQKQKIGFLQKTSSHLSSTLMACDVSTTTLLLIQSTCSIAIPKLISQEMAGGYLLFQQVNFTLDRYSWKISETHWGRHGNASIQIAAKAICTNAAIKKTFFDSCVGSVIPASALQSLMDRIVLKVFHARAGASMNAWKLKKHSSGGERLIRCCFSSGSEVESVKDDEGGWRVCDQKKRGPCAN